MKNGVEVLGERKPPPRQAIALMASYRLSHDLTVTTLTCIHLLNCQSYGAVIVFGII